MASAANPASADELDHGADQRRPAAGRGLRPGPAPAWLAIVVPVLAEVAVGGYRIGGPSLWRDEASTISGSQRSFGAIWAMIGHQDAVHAPYYFLMHVVIAIGGISATTLRLPSLAASAAAAGLTAALGVRLARDSGLPAPRLTGCAAGLALVAVPLTTRYAQEARPYAFATLFAVAASYLLVAALRRPSAGRWTAYGAALVLTGMANLLALSLVAAHGVSLLLAGRPDRRGVRRVPGRWLAASASAGLVLAPMIVVSATQSSQLNWVTVPGASAVASLLRDFSGSVVLVPVIAALAGLGLLAGPGLRRPALRRSDGGGDPGSPAGGPVPARLTLAVLALPWLVLPPVLLLAVSQFHPIYVERYVMFCLPALSLLTAAGLAWLGLLLSRAAAARSVTGPRAGLLAVVPPALLAVLIAAAVAGPQASIRQASARPDNLRAVAAVLSAKERPGDAIMFAPWDASVVAAAYPAPYLRLRDAGMGVSPVSSGTLRGLQAPPAVVASRLRSAARVWVLSWATSPADRNQARLPAPVARLTGPLRAVRTWHISSVVLTLYVAG